MKGLWIAVAGVLLTGCATLQYGSPQASAELKNAKGEVVGTASFWQDAGGVRVVAQVRGLSAGKHGTHPGQPPSSTPTEARWWSTPTPMMT